MDSSSFGRASVATSQSLAARPRSRSRTQPPTTHDRFPLSGRRSRKAGTGGGTAARSTRSVSTPVGLTTGPTPGYSFVYETSLPGGPPMLDFSEEHKLAQKAIRAWCTTNLAPRVTKLESGEPPYALMRELGAAFGVPDMVRAQFARMLEDKDGAARPLGGNAPGGESPLMAILMMELSRFCPGFALAFGASLGLCGGGIMAKGTRAQKERFALPVLTMQKIGCWALTEPGAGSDAFGSMKTHARKVDGGWRLSGAKTFITNAPYADVLLVDARMPGDEGIRAFLVERGQGVDTSAPFRKMGMHASPTGEGFLDDVFVPADQLLRGGETENARA